MSNGELSGPGGFRDRSDMRISVRRPAGGDRLRTGDEAVVGGSAFDQLYGVADILVGPDEFERRAENVSGFFSLADAISRPERVRS